MKSSIITFLTLATAASAHFELLVPTSRGNDDTNQATGPCGGLNTPSAVRSEWALDGGEIRFEAGHDEANTAVYLALGNNPTAKDFNITIAEKFLQTGLGTFCWQKLSIPANISGIAAGVNATIQVIQEGHTGGGLYNCADITFVTDPPLSIADCANSTGVGAEPAADDTPSPTASGTGSESSPTSTPNSAAKLAGSVMAAGVFALFGFAL